MIDRSKFKATPLFLYRKEAIQEQIRIITDLLDDALFNYKQKVNEIDISAKINDENYSFFEQEYFDNGSVFPQIIKRSSLINLYSYFEYELKNLTITNIALCNRSLDRESINSLIKVKKKKLWNKPEIFVFKTILTEDLGIDLIKFENDYIQIDKTREIRNRIIHNQSQLKETDNKDIIIHSRYLNINNYREIYINDSKYIQIFAKQIEGYLLYIYEVAVEKYYNT